MIAVTLGRRSEKKWQPLEGQEMEWVFPEDLPRYEFPAADAALLIHLKPKP